MKPNSKPVSFTDYMSQNFKDSEYQKAYSSLDSDPDILLMEALALARQKGLTQKDIAKRMGTTQSAISRTFSAKGNPTLDFLRRYASALNLNLKIEFV